MIETVRYVIMESEKQRSRGRESVREEAVAPCAHEGNELVN